MMLLILLQAGLFGGVRTLLKKVGLPAWEEKALSFEKLDQQIKDYYRFSRKRFVWSSFCNFMAWMIGVLETFFLARFLGIPISFGEAWLLEALVQAIRVVTFFIPSSIGVQEGGIVFLFTEFGYSPLLATTFAVLRRLREMLWVAIGLGLWFLQKD